MLTRLLQTSCQKYQVCNTTFFVQKLTFAIFTCAGLDTWMAIQRLFLTSFETEYPHCPVKSLIADTWFLVPWGAAYGHLCERFCLSTPFALFSNTTASFKKTEATHTFYETFLSFHLCNLYFVCKISQVMQCWLKLINNIDSGHTLSLYNFENLEHNREELTNRYWWKDWNIFSC